MKPFNFLKYLFLLVLLGIAVFRLVFKNLGLPQDVITLLSPTINGKVVNTGFEVLIILGFTLILIFVASTAFRD